MFLQRCLRTQARDFPIGFHCRSATPMIRRSSVANTSIESNIRSESHVLLPELLSVEEAFLRACLNGLFAPRFHLCRLEITGVRLAGRIGAEMWTEAHWARHKAAPKKIVLICAVKKMARWVERVDPPPSARATPVSLVVSAIAWHLRVGGPWRALAGDFPAWRTVYGCFVTGWSWGCSTGCYATWPACGVVLRAGDPSPV